MKVVDDFLDKNLFTDIYNIMTSDVFPWYFNNDIIHSKPEKILIDNFQFTHNFYMDYAPNSSYFNLIKPILYKLNAVAILRVKSNLLTRTEKIKEHEIHIDNKYVDNYKIAILYINTCNGYTKLKDNTKIDSIENRALFFDPSINHQSTTCTNAKARFNMNINYF